MPTEPDLERLRSIARRAALAGGAVVLTGNPAGPAEAKGAGDYVTEVDRAAEAAIKALLAAETPDVPVLGEEEGGSPPPGGRHWVVDPLDGTANFMHGFHVVGVSVALVEDGRPVAGAVHAPFLGETWVAARGLGAFRGARRLRVSDRPVEEAIVATGFPFRRKEVLGRYLEVLRRGLERFEDLRRPGAASLDLAWVAEGVFDGFFELGLSSWDVAGGALLIEEAGGVVTDWSGGPDYLSGDILAASPALHAALLELVRAGP